jgi:hypothetical protein
MRNRPSRPWKAFERSSEDATGDVQRLSLAHHRVRGPLARPLLSSVSAAKFVSNSMTLSMALSRVRSRFKRGRALDLLATGAFDELGSADAVVGVDVLVGDRKLPSLPRRPWRVRSGG